LIQHRLQLNKLSLWSELWSAYSSEDLHQLEEISSKLIVDYSFVEAAIKAEKDRKSLIDSGSGPVAELKSIIDELNTYHFGTVFQEFTKRAAIYGFGDWQVRKLMAQIEPPALSKEED
jgi:hypothetical protein